MKSLAWLAVPFLLLTGCVQSLHPYYTDGQVTWEKNLIGYWSDADGKNILDIPAATADEDQKEYRVAYTDEHGKTGHFIAKLAKVDKYLLADFTPEEMTELEGGMYKAHFLPVHSFMLIEVGPQSLKVRAMDYDWLKKELADRPDAVAHEIVDKDRIVLTAPSEKVQAFVIKHAETPGAYGDWTEFKRSTPKPTTQPIK